LGPRVTLGVTRPVTPAADTGRVPWKSREQRNAYQRAYRAARGIHPRAPRPTRSCPRCGKPVPPANRRFCSRQCYDAAREEEREAAFVSGSLNPTTRAGAGCGVPRWVRRWWIAHFGERCQLCGWSSPHPITGRVPLEWDHIDGDCSNNRFTNLRLLCPNCRALSETHAVN
jgi:hypothetical protein